jgi:hypothetical protein
MATAITKLKPSSVARGIALVFIAAVFSVAAVAKQRSFREFEATLQASHLVPSLALATFATTIIALEAVIALGLLVPILQPILRKLCLSLAMLLSCTFISYSVWRWHEGIQAPCHCFGILFTMTPLASILLNMMLLTAILYLLDGEESAGTR